MENSDEFIPIVNNLVRISSTALFVNEMIAILDGSMPALSNLRMRRYLLFPYLATRSINTLVFPEPGPAETDTNLSLLFAAAFGAVAPSEELPPDNSTPAPGEEPTSKTPLIVP